MKKKDCFIRRVYERWTPHVQMAGYIMLISTYAYGAISVKEKALAFDGRLTAAEQAVNRLGAVEQKLDLAIDLLRHK